MCNKGNFCAKDCPMYECNKFSEECLHCKWLKKQKRIAHISQIGLFIAIISYVVITANIW